MNIVNRTIVNGVDLPLNRGATLVIGYGNTLRGDDGVGYHIALTVQQWQHPDWIGYPCQQLTPDLAALMADFATVVFVDAAIAPVATPKAAAIGQVQWQRIAPESGVSSMTHTASPSGLLALAQWLYNACPFVYLVTISTSYFDFTETLSPGAIAGQTQVLDQLYQWQMATAAASGQRLASDA